MVADVSKRTRKASSVNRGMPMHRSLRCHAKLEHRLLCTLALSLIIGAGLVANQWRGSGPLGAANFQGLLTV